MRPGPLHQAGQRVAKKEETNAGIQIDRKHQASIAGGIDDRVATADKLTYPND
jgi:hypothetical protein